MAADQYTDINALDTVLKQVLNHREITEEESRRLCGMLPLGCRILGAPADETFIRCGFPVDKIWLLLRGHATVQCYGPQGTSIIQDSFCAPQLFGVIELVEHQCVFSASVVTAAPSQLLEIPALLFNRAMNEDLRVARIVIDDLASLARRNMDTIEAHGLLCPRDTLALYLYQCCQQSALPYTCCITRQTVAALLRINQRSLYRYLNQLCAMGLCSSLNRKTVITEEQFARLRTYCETLN